MRKTGLSVNLGVLLLGVASLAIAVVPMPVISRNAPTFDSSDPTGQNHHSDPLRDSTYSNWWQLDVPGWIVYDLSGVPAAQRSRILCIWYNEDTGQYQRINVASECTGPSYGQIGSYTIDINAAPGGGTPPATGWVTAVTVTGNICHSRQHAVDFAGYNWVRLNITAGDEGTNIGLRKFEIHNASQGTEDDWIFFGDSITQAIMTHTLQTVPSGPSVDVYGALIHAQLPEYFPAQENGGIGCVFLTSMANENYTLFCQWLDRFPGQYVTLSYGTNDGWGGNPDTDAFYTGFVRLVNAVLSRGKTPVVSKVFWSAVDSVRQGAQLLNVKIDELYANYPQVVRGPDFFTLFQSQPALVGGDGVHPSDLGIGEARKEWARLMIANIYRPGLPVVFINSPMQNGTFTSPAAITLTATASESGGGAIDKVEFFQNAVKLGEDLSAPYSFTWNNVPSGTYTLKVIATDHAGNTASAQVDVNVYDPLPSPWQHQDVGVPSPAGLASFSGGAFTVKGAGADIWDAADAFHFVYQTLTGDGEIVARIVSQQNTNGWAKCGVMLRETLAAGSAHAMMVLTPGNGLRYQWRGAANGASSDYAGGAASAPIWVRLVRQGNTLSGYRSANGSAWTLVTSQTIAMASQVFIGLAVDSANNGVLNTSVLDSVAVTTAPAGTATITPTPAPPTATRTATQIISPTITPTPAPPTATRTATQIVSPTITPTPAPPTATWTPGMTEDKNTLSRVKMISPEPADGINDAAVFGPAALEITIQDLRGREIFHARKAMPSEPALAWNGRDQAGRLVRAGVYLAKIRNSAGRVLYQALCIIK